MASLFHRALVVLVILCLLFFLVLPFGFVAAIALPNLLPSRATVHPFFFEHNAHPTLVRDYEAFAPGEPVGALPLVSWLVLSAGVLLIAILMLVVMVVVMLRGRSKSREAAGISAEESRLMQELHQGFNRLEERVEALETILLDRAKKREQSYADKIQ